MIALYTLLLALNLAMMAGLFRTWCLRGGRVHINPVFGLLVGLSFYVLLPCTVTAFYGEELGSLTAFDHYFHLHNATVVMLFTTFLLGAVALGAAMARPRRRTTPRSATAVQPLPPPRIPVATWLMFGAYAGLVLLAFSIRSFLFMGYDESVLESDAVWAARGAMSSFYSLIYISACSIVIERGGSLSRPMRLGTALVFISSSVLLLSIGARLYVAMALISLLALYSRQSGGIPAARLLLVLLGGATAFGALGVLRSGSLTDLTMVAITVAIEPIMTSISLFTVLTDNPTIWLGKLHLFPGDFQAILPSFLFPEKAGLFERIGDYGYAYDAPIGGFHLYFSALINFGIIGSIALAIPCGYAIARLSRSARLARSAALTSIFLTGALTFTIFRDPFFISIVKNVFVMCVVVPWFLSLNEPRRRRRKRPVVAATGASA